MGWHGQTALALVGLGRCPSVCNTYGGAGLSHVVAMHVGLSLSYPSPATQLSVSAPMWPGGERLQCTVPSVPHPCSREEPADQGPHEGPGQKPHGSARVARGPSAQGVAREGHASRRAAPGRVMRWTQLWRWLSGSSPMPARGIGRLRPEAGWVYLKNRRQRPHF